MIRTFYILTSFLTAIFILASCEQSVTVSSFDENKLLIECELNPNKEIQARVYLINSFNQIDRNQVISNAVLRLTTGIDEAIPFQYNKAENYYFIPKSYHTVRQDGNYTIIGYLPENEELKISGNTQIPVSKKFNNLKSTSATFEKNLKNYAAFTTNLSLDGVEYTSNKFYRLVPIIKRQNGTMEPVQFDGNDLEPLAFHISKVDGSILFDASRVDSKDFNLKFSTLTPLKKDEKISCIHYKLESITEASYRYHLAKSKMINGYSSGSFIPVINYSNMINGYGYLGASATATDSLIIE